MNLMFWKKAPKWTRTQYPWAISPAFKLDGIQYYEVDDYVNIPCQRALTAITYYEELSMKCTKDFLVGHVEAMVAALNKGKLNVAFQLTSDLRHRLDFVYEPDILMKLASVVYFDANEDPTTYDFEYNKKKIEGWKKMRLGEFLSSVPLSRLVPSLDFSKVDLQKFTNLGDMIMGETLDHLETILGQLSPEALNNDSLKSLESLRKQLRELTLSEV